jgi:hypothetical protein
MINCVENTKQTLCTKEVDPSFHRLPIVACPEYKAVKSNESTRAVVLHALRLFRKQGLTLRTTNKAIFHISDDACFH